MNKTVIGAILLFLLVVGGAVAVKFLLPLFEEQQQKATSDATRTKGKIRVAMDNWIGYFPLRSSEMKARMRKAGYQLITEDDNADYRQRSVGGQHAGQMSGMTRPGNDYFHSPFQGGGGKISRPLWTSMGRGHGHCVRYLKIF